VAAVVAVGVGVSLLETFATIPSRIGEKDVADTIGGEGAIDGDVELIGVAGGSVKLAIFITFRTFSELVLRPDEDSE
jgi:hypothetical protein